MKEILSLNPNRQTFILHPSSLILCPQGIAPSLNSFIPAVSAAPKSAPSTSANSISKPVPSESSAKAASSASYPLARKQRRLLSFISTSEPIPPPLIRGGGRQVGFHFSSSKTAGASRPAWSITLFLK